MEFRQVLSIELLKLMAEDEKVVVLDADLGSPDGLGPVFKEYPKRAIQVGIAEANMTGIAAGFSAYGYQPVMVTFAPFATRRVFDQIAVSVAYAKQNVKIVGTDPGITAELNGGTHMTFEDIALMRSLPDMVVFDAVDDIQLQAFLPSLLKQKGNVYIRTPRKNRPRVFDENTTFEYGKANVVKEGCDVTIIATGTMVYEATLACEMLKEEGVSACVISANFIKPLDNETILKSIKNTKCAVVCENHNLKGGLFSAVTELVCKECPIPVEGVGINDEFGQVGKYNELLSYYKLTKEDIVSKVKEVLKRK